jgi:CRP-like cAMP-binding protein
MKKDDASPPRPGSGIRRQLGNVNPVRGNLLLSLLTPKELKRVRSHSEEVVLTFSEPLHNQNSPIEYAYFPHSGVCSLTRSPFSKGGLSVELATIGNEGMVGLPLALGDDRMPFKCFCQVTGQAARIEAAAFKELIETCPSLLRVLLRYAQALLSQIAQSAACNRMHPIEERCARWLLMTQDRVGADHFALTQEFLAQMLGVRRPSVSVAASMLQRAGLIQYSRGLVVITDRAGLEAATCDCYRVINDEFERLLH